MTEAPVTLLSAAAELVPNGDRRQRLMESVGPACPDIRCSIADAERPAPAKCWSGAAMSWPAIGRTRRRKPSALRDGWLHTGDIGELDDDGNLSIVGRLNESSVPGSSTIMPKEVEDVIRRIPRSARSP